MARNARGFIAVSVFLSLFLAILARPKDGACPDGQYGVSCEKNCGMGCRNNCNKTSGACIGGCLSGWSGEYCDVRCKKYYYGPNCLRSCGHCQRDITCDPTSGVCHNGCVPGFRGKECDQPCEPYTFGRECKGKCGYCRRRQTCNAVTGVCSGGCEPGWEGQRCEQKCPPGTYGIDCTLLCGGCIGQTSCDHETGQCLQGCEPGRLGFKCLQSCQHGRYGESCRGVCGRCLKGTCDHVTGECADGCARGWSGERCQHECVQGQYGTNCTLKCGHCQNSSLCDPINGICSRGCAPGWKGVFCQDECDPGFYGEDCKFRCGKCAGGPDCDKDTGSCPHGCELGWTGRRCAQVMLQKALPSTLKPVLPVLIVSLVVIVLVLSSTILYFMVIRPRRLGLPSRLYRLTHGAGSEQSSNTYEIIQGSPLEIQRSNLILTNDQLGNGQFGQVKKGFVKKERGVKVPVAVKSLKDNASDKDKRDFLNELAILKAVGKHENVVCLVGACHIRGVMYVAMEYCKHGDMRTFLRRSRKMKNHTYSNTDHCSTLRLTTLIKFALDTAEGLCHLAEKQIIHRDVAARNVLLGDHLVAKIADFGLSKNDETYVKTSSTRVPIRWMAVESLFSNTYTTQSDVWSFGILLWEIFTLGGTPYSSIDTQQLFTLLKEGYRLKRPKLCDDNMYAMMLQCWNERPERRPTFHEIIGRLHRILEDSQVYMNLTADDESLYAEIEHVKDAERSLD
ncbi:angiopoietin-1 receptor-like [Haliotis cracherodii]|uniref:angiopoietin-1 receptor-like n=1 Tax=Haliotis cracherodii TaxID=6455 RepID=UPI0039E75A62